VEKVKELRSGKEWKVDKKSNSFKVKIGPGDVAVIKIPVKDLP
jgi:ribosomal protein S4E